MLALHLQAWATSRLPCPQSQHSGVGLWVSAGQLPPPGTPLLASGMQAGFCGEEPPAGAHA